MRSNKARCALRTTASSSIGLSFLAVALLVLSPGWAAGEEKLNVPPDGFTALFNGKDFTGWQLSPLAEEAWSIEDGVLKSHGGFKDYSSTLITDEKKKYRDFVLLADYREPTMSVSGIHFRGLPDKGDQVNICSLGWMGHPIRFHFLPADSKVTKEQYPQVKTISPKIGAWHTMKLTLIGKTLSVEVDGEVILDEFAHGAISAVDPVIDNET